MCLSIPPPGRLRDLVARIHAFPSRGVGRARALAVILDAAAPLYGTRRKMWCALGVTELQLFKRLCAEEHRERLALKATLMKIRERAVSLLPAPASHPLLDLVMALGGRTLYDDGAVTLIVFADD